MSSVTRRGLLAVSALLPLARVLPAGGCEVPAGPPRGRALRTARLGTGDDAAAFLSRTSS